ncbi:hypothetical protein [Ferruginibacter profundus]
MKNLFYSSYYLWVISRLLVIILFGYSLVEVAGAERHLNSIEFLVNFLFFIYLILNLVLCIKELQGHPKSKIIAIITGSFSITMSAIAIYLLMSFRTRYTEIAYMLAFWLLLLGLFDLCCIDNKKADTFTEEEDSNET